MGGGRVVSQEHPFGPSSAHEFRRFPTPRGNRPWSPQTATVLGRQAKPCAQHVFSIFAPEALAIEGAEAVRLTGFTPLIPPAAMA